MIGSPVTFGQGSSTRKTMPRGCGKKALLAMAAAFGFVTVPFFILLIHAIATGGNVLLTLIATVMLAMPTLLFLFLGLRNPVEQPFRMNKSIERHVLHMAAINDGELTAAKLALGSQLRLDQCQRALEEFESMGVAQGLIGSSGEMRYTFPELKESMIEDDDFMRRLHQEDPRSVLDFDVSDERQQRQPHTAGVSQEQHETKG
jgi:hypothetical protein